MIARERNFDTAQEVYPPGGAPKYEYPFAESGDSDTFIVTRTYKQTSDGYRADQALNVFKVGSTTDRVHANAYLLPSSPPETTTTGLVTFTRSFATIPRDQVRYSSRAIARPNVTNQASSVYSISSTPYVTTEVATAIKNATGWFLSDGSVFAPLISGPMTTQANQATAGQFYIRYGNVLDSGPFAYNASGATIQSAMNTTLSGNGITVTVTNALTSPTDPEVFITVTSGSASQGFRLINDTLTMSGGTVLFSTLNNSATNIELRAWHLLPITGHGLTASGDLLLVSNTASTGKRFTSSNWAVHDANNIAVPVSYNTAFQSVAEYYSTYFAGAAQMPTRITERYYLPGITPGISQVSDIPIEDPAGADTDILGTFLSGASGATTVIDFEGPVAWRWPIHKTTTTEAFV